MPKPTAIRTHNSRSAWLTTMVVDCRNTMVKPRNGTAWLQSRV
jgi:hypothetical protein